MNAQTLQSIIDAINDNVDALIKMQQRYARVARTLNRLMTDAQTAWNSNVAATYVTCGRDLAETVRSISHIFRDARDALSALGRTTEQLWELLSAAERRLQQAHSAVAAYEDLIRGTDPTNELRIASLRRSQDQQRAEIGATLREMERIQQEWERACRACLTAIELSVQSLPTTLPLFDVSRTDVVAALIGGLSSVETSMLEKAYSGYFDRWHANPDNVVVTTKIDVEVRRRAHPRRAHPRAAHPRRAYFRADGTFVRATNVRASNVRATNVKAVLDFIERETGRDYLGRKPPDVRTVSQAWRVTKGILGPVGFVVTYASARITEHERLSGRDDLTQNQIEQGAARAARLSSVGGHVGAIGGAKLGAVLGAPLGPAGVLVGAFIGGAVGGWAASEAGRRVGSRLNDWEYGQPAVLVELP